MLTLARISPINIYLNLFGLQYSNENLFELCLNDFIFMKLLFPETSDIAPILSKKF